MHIFTFSTRGTRTGQSRCRSFRSCWPRSSSETASSQATCCNYRDNESHYRGRRTASRGLTGEASIPTCSADKEIHSQPPVICSCPCPCPYPYPDLHQHTTHHLISLGTILTLRLNSHLRLGFPSVLFRQTFRTSYCMHVWGARDIVVG